MRAAPLFAVGAISALSIGLAVELACSVIAVGWQLDNTTAAQAGTIAVFVGGVVLGGFSALHYWLPKVTGRMMGEGLGKVSLAAILLGLYVYVLMAFFAGRQGPAGRHLQVLRRQGVATASTWSPRSPPSSSRSGSCSSWQRRPQLPARRSRRRTTRGAAPTLEWFALSPPSAHNFDAVPDVRSAEPLLDIREAIRDRTEAGDRPRHPGPPRPSGPASPRARPAPPAGEGAAGDASVS